jgi:hypothetical protein
LDLQASDRLDCIDDLDGLCARFAEEGVFVRPFGSIVYLTPAFTIGEEELARFFAPQAGPAVSGRPDNMRVDSEQFSSAPRT